MRRLDDPVARNAIEFRYALYNLASDWGTPEEYAACFTEDGTLAAPEIEVTGRAALVEYKRNDQANRALPVRRHVNGSVALAWGDSGGVLGVCYLLAYNGSGSDVLSLADSGVYFDHLVNHDGEWLFHSRTLRFDRVDPLLPGERSVYASLSPERPELGAPPARTIPHWEDR